jgi:hypothetical protein
MTGLTFWVSHGLVAMFLFACPDCGFSLFRSDGSFFCGRTIPAKQHMFQMRLGPFALNEQPRI